jgi:hypothetical protein
MASHIEAQRAKRYILIYICITVTQLERLEFYWCCNWGGKGMLRLAQVMITWGRDCISASLDRPVVNCVMGN